MRSRRDWPPPEPWRYQPPIQPGEGKIARGLRMLSACWSYLRERPRLMVLPTTAAILGMLACALMCGGIALWEDDISLALLIPLVLAGSLIASFVANFLAVAFLCMVVDDMNGHDLGVGRGVAFAWSRRRSITVWSGIATAFGLLIGAIQQIPGIGGFVSSLIGWLGGLVWQLATFFVLPILVIEEVSAREALRRSTRAFKARWGESVTADFAIWSAYSLMAFPLFVAFAISVGLVADGLIAIGVVVGGVALAGIVATAAYTNAAMRIFQLAVYRQTACGEVVGPYAAPDLDRVAKPRRRWLKRA